MFTYNERDLHRMPPAARTHLPIKPFINETGIIDDDETAADGRSNDAADITLTRLPAPNLRGTFSKAYALLTRLVAQIGWDELLKSRSAVFVMEEEYRMQKAVDDIRPSLDEDEEGRDADRDSSTGHEDEDSASTRAMVSPPGSPRHTNGDVPASDVGSSTLASHSHHAPQPSTDSVIPGPDVPIIKVSDEPEWQEADKAKAESTVNLNNNANGNDAETDVADMMVNGDDNIAKTDDLETTETETIVSKPEQAAAGPSEETTTSAAENVTAENERSEGFSFSNKRLCERWLDNLFMVLYEVRGFESDCLRERN